MKSKEPSPQSLREAEFIGSLVTFPRSIENISIGLRGSDFTVSAMGLAWERIKNKHQKGGPIDLASVVAELDEETATVVLDAASIAATSVYVEQHATGIMKAAIARELARGLQSLVVGDIDQLLLEAAELIGTAQDRIGSASSDQIFETTADRMSQVIISAEEARNKGFSGHRTGIRFLDRMTGGMRPGSTWIVGGRPSSGKSAMMTQIASYMAKAGTKVIYVSAEMPTLEIARREASQATGINLLKLISGTMSDTEWSDLVRTANDLSTSPGDNLLMTHRMVTDVEAILSTLRRLKRQSKLDVVLIDFLQKLNARRLISRQANRTTELEVICGLFSAFARESGTCVVLASSLSRGGTTESRPSFARLRDSGAIESDGDVVVLLWRPDPDIATREIILDKNRQGPTGAEHWHFDENRLMFYEIDDRPTR